MVYEIPCLGCSGTYAGQTKQWLKQRITQHRSDYRLAKNSSALALHHINTGHGFDFNNAKILERDSNYYSRLFLKMSHINKTKNEINFKSDTQQISNIYCNILNQI